MANNTPVEYHQSTCKILSLTRGCIVATWVQKRFHRRRSNRHSAYETEHFVPTISSPRRTSICSVANSSDAVFTGLFLSSRQMGEMNWRKRFKELGSSNGSPASSTALTFSSRAVHLNMSGSTAGWGEFFRQPTNILLLSIC